LIFLNASRREDERMRVSQFVKSPSTLSTSLTPIPHHILMPLKPNRCGSSRGGGSNTRFTGKRGGGSFRGKGRGGGVAYGIDRPAPQREDDGTAAAEKFEEVRVWDEIDTKLGFERFESGRASGEEKVGWMVNMHQVRQAGKAELLLGQERF